MKDLRRRFERFCLKNRGKGIPNLMLVIAIGNLAVYALSYIDPSNIVYSYLCFSRSAILRGQVWRLFSYIFTYLNDVRGAGLLLAAVSLSAQDVTAIYNEAAAAFGAKDFAGAAAKFEQVIEQGLDSEEAASLVATAKTTLPKCYFMMGGGAIRTKNYDEALKNFTKSAELAEHYGDMSQMAKANGWVAKIYQIQGGDAFNNKDYATAAGVFEKGYKADPDNTAMALNLAMSYCEMGEYEKGMDIYEAVAAKTHPKYADDAAKAKEMIALYTNNKVATLQAANDFDGIIAMADALLAKNAENALAQKVRLQAYASKKDYNKVIELGEAAAKVQTDPEDVSLMYLTLGAAYNAKEMKPQAIEAFRKVTAGPAVESAKAALAELTK